MKSNCCLSTLITRSSDEGTSYYECKACGEPCDVAPQNQTKKCCDYKDCICGPVHYRGVHLHNCPAIQNQTPLDTGHHAEYEYKKNQTKGVCGHVNREERDIPIGGDGDYKIIDWCLVKEDGGKWVPDERFRVVE